jgi:hypothetical protein
MADETPVRQELTLLKSDNPELREIGFTIRERQGTPVFKFLAEDHAENLDLTKLVDITQEEGLVAGDRILVPGLMGGYHLLTVEAHPEGGLSAHNDRLLAILEFGKDERNAWVCTGLINRKGLLKLRITT